VTDSGTDRQTDGRTGVSKERAIAYMLSRAKNAVSTYEVLSMDKNWLQLCQLWTLSGKQFCEDSAATAFC